jgi:hypothetical protein
MRAAALPLLLLGACASYQDTPADPRLADVTILEIRAPAGEIARSQTALAYGGGNVLAYSRLIREANLCIIVLPISNDKAFIARLRAHETRHCHGEQHHGARFLDEAPL